MSSPHFHLRKNETFTIRQLRAPLTLQKKTMARKNSNAKDWEAYRHQNTEYKMTQLIPFIYPPQYLKGSLFNIFQDGVL